MKVFYRISLKSYDKVFFQNNDDKLFFFSEKLINKDKTIQILLEDSVNIKKFNSNIYPKKITFSLASRMIQKIRV